MVANGQQTDRQRRIYVVDDDDMVREALFFTLTAAGYEVRTFALGQKVLEELDELGPGCILLDVRMPDMDGGEVLSKLGKRVSSFPVIMITGHGDIDMAVRTLKLGAVDFLEKPFSEEVLFSVLEPLFGSVPAQVEAEHRRARARASIAALTPREREVLQCAVDGLADKAAARKLGVSLLTVELHCANLVRTLNVSSIR